MSEPATDNFDALYEITQTINGILEPQALLDQVLDIALTHLQAERGFLILIGGHSTQPFEVMAARNFTGEHSPSLFAASSSVLSKVLSTGESVLAFDAMADEEFQASRSVIAQKIRSVICVPLRVSDAVTGAVYLDSTRARGKFNEQTLRFLTVFGHLAAIAIENARRYDSLKLENERLRSEAPHALLFKALIGKSRAWQSVLDTIRQVARTDVSVLLTGESGTGKELVARAIHENSTRSGKPFVVVNCAAIPDQLLESELFGHRRGAFTGAHADARGLVEVASGGTLFLDEIPELPLPLQTKILRLLQEREIRRVGDTSSRRIDVRILAATNRNLEAEIGAGRFREDLFYRLNVVNILLPPLRNRRDDIPLLSAHFLKAAAAAHRRPVEGFAPAAMRAILDYPWPGNVRELQNVIERAVVLSRSPLIAPDDLRLPEGHPAGAGPTLETVVREFVDRTLREMDGNRRRTAEKLGVSLRWLHYRLKEWNREPGEVHDPSDTQ
jgi:Nif-specific regulatory protein